MVDGLKRLILWSAASLALAVAPHVIAEDYPTKPIRIIVPVGAGNAWDVRVRQLAEIISRSTGHPVVVENRPGAGTTLAAGLVAKSPPDGYTILAATQADQAIAPAVYSSLSYDPAKDFAAIAQVVAGTPVLVVNASVRAKTLRELVALAKQNPGHLTYASYGYGTFTHLLLSELNRTAAIDITHVPYKSGADGLADVIAGRVSMMFDFYTTCGQYIKDGKLQPLMVASEGRHRALPEVPTAAELGMPSIARRAWGGFVVPAKTPKDIIERLNREFVMAAQTPSFRQSVEAAGADVVTSTPDAFKAFISKEREEFQRLAKQSGAKID